MKLPHNCKNCGKNDFTKMREAPGETKNMKKVEYRCDHCLRLELRIEPSLEIKRDRGMSL